MIKKVIISILLQLALIPFLYGVLYGIARIFHEPYVRTGGAHTDFYALTLTYLIGFVLITLPILNIIQSFIIKNIYLSTLLHVVWFTFIVWFTQGDLKYRPYDYGLILFCIGLSIATRVIVNKGLKLP